MFQSHFEELVSFPLFYKFLCHVPTIFVLLEFCLQIPLTCIFSSAVSYLIDMRPCGPATPSILKIYADKHLFWKLMLFCSWERRQQKEQRATHSVSASLCACVSLWKRQQPAQLLMELQAGLCGCGGLHVQGISPWLLIFVHVISGKWKSVKGSIHPTFRNT